MYIPKNERAKDLCKLIGYEAYIPGEKMMDRVFCFLDELGVEVQFFETGGREAIG